MDMDLPQDQHSGSSTNPIIIEVPGISSILIPDSTLLKMEESENLNYHRGFVKSGNEIDKIDACEAIVFKYEEVKSASEKYAKLAAFNHRCVLEALGHGQGFVGPRRYSFLALRPFKKTFEAYIAKDGYGADQNNRLKPNFIKLVSDIIDGLEELHLLGYYCPNLKSDDIAVIEQNGLVTAKLWHFRERVSGDKKEKDQVWPKLGHMILKAANRSNEAQDLYKRIISGQLKGKSILRHSCLLTVRTKFNNVLAFQFHISIYYPNMLSQSHTNQSKKLQISDLCGANLQNDLDRPLPWAMPACVTSQSQTNPPKTLRGFIRKLRDVFEHEDVFIPEE